MCPEQMYTQNIYQLCIEFSGGVRITEMDRDINSIVYYDYRLSQSKMQMHSYGSEDCVLWPTICGFLVESQQTKF